MNAQTAALPQRWTLRATMWSLNLAGLASLAFGVVRAFQNLHDQDVEYYGYHPYPWSEVFGLIGGGVIALIVGYNVLHYWFGTVVGTGEVVDHEWSSSFSGETYRLVVKGRNRVGREFEQYISVEPKTYHDKNDGDDFNTGRK